ncbi:MAG TPA: TIM barrel protein [Pirellulales bacterium]|nr:TIM barrel protein [Pirellulales bacterium]
MATLLRIAPGLSLPFLSVLALLAGMQTQAAAADNCSELFSRNNLVAWCIVPFDRAKRTPEERAAMLERLGFERFAYDWRAEQLPTFEREIAALKEHHISLDAVWFPAALNDEARTILEALRRHNIHTQLWVTMGDPAPQGDQAAKLAAAAATIKPIADEAAKLGCKVALYNHGGWFGEPENELAVVQRLGMPNVGIVYNLHHGHDHLDRFVTLLEKMLPHLLALNLNGMDREGDHVGRKILPLGQGAIDLPLLRTICASGYRGPIGILGHTQDDAEERLRDNLDGLDWLVAQLQYQSPRREKPTPRTTVGELPAMPAGQFLGRIAEGRADYRQPPLSVECRARLTARDNYNILVANDTKQSGAHWELFSMAGSGTLTAYLPGMKPDHVRSSRDVCDGEWHGVAMLYEPARVRLLVDGEVVADQAMEATGKAAVPGSLALGRLVEGGLGCNGEIAHVRLSRGVRERPHRGDGPPQADEQTVGLWVFTEPSGDTLDRSKLKNIARQVAGETREQGLVPPPGPNLLPADAFSRSQVVDRSRDDAYLGVKVDSAGRVFVGAREAVYLFEPAPGGFLLRQQVCRLPPDSIVMDVEFRGDDLYVLADNALYLLPRGRVELGVNPRRILWGLPLDLHVSFHCLAWGPEGDLYLTHGDPLLNYGDWNRPDHWGHWTLYCGPNGERVPYTGVGAVLRMRPDGSRVQVVAGGLRGPVGLAFSPRWDLFTNDNDHESRADLYAPARLLHVTPHIDFAWPRGWMASKSPWRYDLVEPLTATMGRGVPCGLVWRDGHVARSLRERKGAPVDDAFPHEPPSRSATSVPLAEQAGYGGSLLMARWDQMTVQNCPLVPRGASFSTREDNYTLGRGFARPVATAIGPDGRFFVTELYLGGNVGSPHCYSDLVMVTNSRETDRQWQPIDVGRVSAERLWQELSHGLWQRRAAAHQELLRRGGDLLDEAAARLAHIDPSGTAKYHLPWLAAASGPADARRLLIGLAKNSDAELRRQALRALAEYRRLEAPDELFTAALDDAEPSVQLAALVALFDRDGDLPVGVIARLAAGDDTYLRQTAAKLLARRATYEELAGLARSDDAADRRTAILAAGFRLTVPPSDYAPPEGLPLSYNSGNASFRLTFADAEKPVDLRALGRVGSFTTAEWWKSAPHTDDERRLFDLLTAALGDSNSDVVEQSAFFLSLLNDPATGPQIAEARRRLLASQAATYAARKVERAWLLGPTGDESFFLEKAAPPDRGPIDLSATYPAGAERLGWKQVEPVEGRFTSSFSSDQPSSRLYLCFQLQSTARQPAVVELADGGPAAVWHNGQAVAIASHGAAFELQPGSNDVLIRVDRPSMNDITVRFRAAKGVVAGVPEKVDFGLLAERLKQAATGGDQVPAELLSADWSNAVSEGDAQRGRALFGSLGCTKCHGVTLEQPGGGAPNLAGLRRRFNTAYVVESVLLPSKQVADPFRGTTLALADGRTLSGLVVNDTDEQLELLLPDAKRATVAKADIEQRAHSTISPMPSGLVKTEQELRDLLAYLFSAQPLPP